MSKPVNAACAVLLAALLAPPARAEGSWGAVAYSPSTHNFGYSHGFPDPESAEVVAIEACLDQGAGDCESAVVFSNACGAVMAGPDGWGHAWDAAGEEAAQARAYDACSANSDGCELVVSHCSPDQLIVAD